MGSIAPPPDFTPACQKDFEDAILAPTLKGMVSEKMDYRGFIFFGLMVKEKLCYLLEYNVRLGDPETQAVLPLLDSDLAALCGAILDGSLQSFPLSWKKGAVCAPVLAAEGYPGPYRKGDPIAFNLPGLARTGAKIFIAGAEKGEGGAPGSGLRSSGGRVMTVSCLGDTPGEARTKAYESLWFINFEGMAYRKDIGLPGGGETNG
jgi:phosphoribosylamine--glycine ligase